MSAPTPAASAGVVFGGVDTHCDTHHAAVVDQVGRLLATSEFPADGAGYRRLLAWVRSFGDLARVGVEGTGAYGAGLTRHLRRTRGKSDPLDAQSAARTALAGSHLPAPKDSTTVVESIRALRLARSGAVKARAAALNQLKDLLVTAPEPLRAALRGRRLTQVANEASRLRPDPTRLADPTQATKTALRSIACRVHDLDTEIAALDAQLAQLVAVAAPHTLQLYAVSTHHAAQLLVTAGANPDRMRSEASFAALCAANPIPASSGKTTRHRLNPAGDRDANATLHMIAVVRMRWHPATRDYVARRTQQGLSKREIIRCLKRYIAREAYHALNADLAAMTT